MNALFSSVSSVVRQLVPVRSVLHEQVRGNVRWFFEECNEVKRIRKFGWKKRMATKNGRKLIMRRILSGKHVLTH